MLLSTSSAVGRSVRASSARAACHPPSCVKRTLDHQRRIRLDTGFAQGRQIACAALRGEIQRQRRADHRNAPVPERRQPTHRVPRAGLVVEIEPRIRLGHLRPAVGHVRKRARLQVRDTRIVDPRARDDQPVDELAVDDAPIGVQFRIRSRRRDDEIEIAFREPLGDARDDLAETRIAEIARAERIDDPDHVRPPGREPARGRIRHIAHFPRSPRHAFARRLADVVVTVQRTADRRPRQPERVRERLQIHLHRRSSHSMCHTACQRAAIVSAR